MQSNKLRMAIRSTAAVAILGVAAQAQAFDFSAGDVDASVYGYVRLNAVYDMDADIGDGSQSGDFSQVSETDETGHFGFSPNQSRFGIKATNSDGVTANVEGDFLNGDFRLRHAYGEYNGVLVGQFWSNYSSFVGNTSILDFNAANATAGFQLRSPQVRYTSGPVSVSVERRQSFDGIIGGSARQSMPAFTARLEDSAGGLSYSLAALATQVTHDNSDGDANQGPATDDSSMAFAAFAAAKMAITDMITVQGALNYSDGANTYLYGSRAPDAYMNGNSLETVAGYGASLGTGISLGNGASVNIGAGMTDVDWDDAIADGAVSAGADDQDETRQNVFVNYQWTPAKNTMMGVEYSYWEAETAASEDSADANRIMFAAQYNF